MNNYGYRIVTRELVSTASDGGRFVAELYDVYIMRDGKQVRPDNLQKIFTGLTQASAIVQANLSVQDWLHCVKNIRDNNRDICS